MNFMVAIIALAVVGCIVLLLVAVSGFMHEVPEADRRFQDPLPAGLRMLWPLVNVATYVLAPRLGADKLEKAHHALQTAGQDFVLTPEQLYGLRVVGSTVAVAVFFLLLAMLRVHGFLPYAVALLLGMMVGWFYPGLWLSERRKRRQRRVIKDLPVFLDFITMAVESGLNLTGAIEQATHKGPVGPVSQEFTRLLRDVRSGLPRSEAFQRMSDRMDMSQISNLTGTLIQADRVGASLGATLRVQAAQRREERFLHAEKLAHEAPVKMMLPLVLFFFPLVFLVIVYFLYLRLKQEGVL